LIARYKYSKNCRFDEFWPWKYKRRIFKIIFYENDVTSDTDNILISHGRADSKIKWKICLELSIELDRTSAGERNKKSWINEQQRTYRKVGTDKRVVFWKRTGHNWIDKAIKR
jgi:hypothetical protein